MSLMPVQTLGPLAAVQEDRATSSRLPARPTGSATGVSPGDATAERTRAASTQIDAALRSLGRQLHFSVDDASGRVVVTVVDTETGETIRQIPAEEVLRIARQSAAADGAEGLLVNLKA
ncbi:MAG: flagellar protein FlaG [Gammaproteobacteria bacterium]|nr:flagellar protein FlaG [Gammaproteobacteria bacterium]